MNRKYLINVFKIEVKGEFQKKNLIVCIVATLILLIILQFSINSLQSAIMDVRTFQEIEKLKPSLFPLYTIYGTYGIRLISSPPTISALFPASMIITRIDTGAGFSIYKDLKRNGVMPEFKGFAGVFVFFVLFMGLYLGILCVDNRELMKYYISLYGKNVYIPIILSRFVLSLILLVLILMLAIIQCLVNGLTLPVFPILFFTFWMGIGVLFFILVGTFFNIFFPKIKIVLAALFFFITLIFIPAQIDELLKINNDSFKKELNSLQQLMRFEKRFANEIGKYKSGKPAPSKVLELIESGQKIEYSKMKSNEFLLFEKSKSIIKKKHFFYSLLPPTFIISMSREMSGSWDIGLLNFTRFSQETREKFIRYYIQKKYYEESKKSIVKPFPHSHFVTLSHNFPYHKTLCLGISFFYLSALFILINYGFKHRLILKPNDDFRSLSVKLKKGELNYLLTKMPSLKNFVFLGFLEKDEFISTDNAVDFEYTSFVYLPQLEKLPLNVERLLNPGIDIEHPRWEIFLRAAIDSHRIVVSTWKLDDFDEENMSRLMDIIQNGIFLNIGEDTITFWLSGNQISWGEDKTIEGRNFFQLAKRLLEKARN